MVPRVYNPATFENPSYMFHLKNRVNKGGGTAAPKTKFKMLKFTIPSLKPILRIYIANGYR